MRQARFPRFVVFATGLLFFTCVAPAFNARPLASPRRPPDDSSLAAQNDSAARALEPGKPVEREIAGGGVHSYRIALASGQFVRIAFTQPGADLRLTLNDPGGKRLFEINGESGAQPPESISFVAEATGTFLLEVGLAEKGAPAESYRLSLEEVRAATAQDRSRVAAEQAFAEGVRLQYAEGKADSLRSAIRKYDEAASLWRSSGDRQSEVKALGSAGAAHASLGEHRKAIEYYEREREIFRAAGERSSESALDENIGRLYYEYLGEKQKALEHLSQALRVYRELASRQAEARLLNMVGKVYADLGANPEEKSKALDYFGQALAIHREDRNRFYEGDTLANLMNASKALRKPRLAIFHGKRAVNVFQEIRSGIKGLEKDTQATFLKSKEAAYRTLADLLVSENRLPEAQQVLGMLKEEEYFEYVRRDGNEASTLSRRAALTPEEAEMEKQYQAIADQLVVRGRQRSELLSKPSRTADEEKQLTKLDSELQTAGAAFQKFLDQLAEEFGDTKQAARVEQIRESQSMMEDLRELGAGSVALYTIVGAEKYRVILITPDVQKAAEYTITAADLSRKVIAFREVLQSPDKDPRPLAQELYRILVGPIAKDLSDAHAETLMWSLDGALRYLPMSALHDGERYMVERYRNIIFTPASSTRLKDPPSAKWNGLGVGVSKAVGGFSALPGVREELGAIIREQETETGGVLAGKLILDEAFTPEAFKALLRQRYKVVHVASHFSVTPGNETDSYLLLGNGGRLTLSEIKSAQNLFGGVELLTLSACDTATGGVSAEGKEVESFAVLAQRQGAKAVVASLWPVADASTKLLMQNFYRLRDAQEGTLKAEALRQAQLLLLRGEGAAGGGSSRGLGKPDGPAPQAQRSFAHPYFWAAFVMIGNWR